MMGQIQAEESMVYTNNETEANGSLELEKHGGDEREEDRSAFGVKSFLWHGGSAWDAWFSCASNQVYNFLPIKNTYIHICIHYIHVHVYVYKHF